MTRKRFVKLLMAEGYSRNSANDIADECLEDGLTYAKAYGYAIKAIPTGYWHDCEAVREAASTTVKAFNAAMRQT